MRTYLRLYTTFSTNTHNTPYKTNTQINHAPFGDGANLLSVVPLRWEAVLGEKHSKTLGIAEGGRDLRMQTVLKAVKEARWKGGCRVGEGLGRTEPIIGA